MTTSEVMSGYQNKTLSTSSTYTCYSHCHAHVLDELHWLNRLIAAHVLHLRRVNFYDGIKDFRDFFIDDEEIDALLAAGILESSGKIDDNKRDSQIEKLLRQAQKLREKIDGCVQMSLAQNIFLPLTQLRNCFHLSESEMKALIICLAPHIDARYGKLYAYLENDITRKYPNVGLILDLLCKTTQERLHLLTLLQPSAPLQRYRLLEGLEDYGQAVSTLRHSLRVNNRIINYVLGNQMIEEQLQQHLHFLPSRCWKDVVLPEEQFHHLQRLLGKMRDDTTGHRSVLNLYGRWGVGKKIIAQALCGDVGVALGVVDVVSLMRSPEAFLEHVRLILREGLLQPCGIYFDCTKFLECSENGSIHLLDNLIREVRELGWLTFFGSQQPLLWSALNSTAIYAVEILPPDFIARKKLWRLHLNGELRDDGNQNIEKLSARFDLTGGQIANAVRMANHSAMVRTPDNGKVTFSDLLASSRIQSQPKLAGLAQKIDSFYTWDDIVLPDDTIAQLSEICQRFTYRHRVLTEWGFDRKLSQGKGISTLFAGPSGTGKTMAAEVIASELGFCLYRIDLSGVVSKYIGETEKNLDHIFTIAEHSNAILFFDEADALFGRRSEVRDSHDRYANIEISYLLQKLEQYESIAILATNLPQNLDESFARRLSFTVYFPFPEEDSRSRIWKGIWPADTPLSENVDLDLLAKQFKISGGNIKNIALAAAFFAAKDGSNVTITHIIKATRREYQKMGRTLSEDELIGFQEEKS